MHLEEPKVTLIITEVFVHVKTSHLVMKHLKAQMILPFMENTRLQSDTAAGLQGRTDGCLLTGSFKAVRRRGDVVLDPVN